MGMVRGSQSTSWCSCGKLASMRPTTQKQSQGPKFTGRLLTMPPLIQTAITPACSLGCCLCHVAWVACAMLHGFNSEPFLCASASGVAML